MIWAPVLVAVCGAQALAAPSMFTGGAAPIDAGDTPGYMLSARACRACHKEVDHEWAASRHARSWTNGIFQREYRVRPQAWCVHCHAPLAQQFEQARGAGGALADEGVSCAVCHVRNGEIISASQHPKSPHETVVRESFGDSQFCAGCHQFNFPVLDANGLPVRSSPHPMQATVAQFDSGPLRDIAGGCRGCHAASKGAHRYPGAHDPAMLARAVRLDACRGTGETVRIDVINIGAGHNVPTGDVHRHLTARVWKATAPEALFDAYIGRRFAADPDGGKRTVWDSTLPPGGRRSFEIDTARLAGGANEPISFELRYVYTAVEFPRAERRGAAPTWRTVQRFRQPLDALPTCRDTREVAAAHADE